MQTPDIHKAQHELVDAMRRLQIAEKKRIELHHASQDASTAVSRLQVEVDQKRVALEKAVADEIDSTRSERVS